MASLPNSKILTYEEWLRTPEVNRKEEVVNGEIRNMAAPSLAHRRIIDKLAYQIRRQVDENEVDVASSAFDLVIRRQPLSTRQPDLAVFQMSSMIERDGRAHSAPQLIVEVRSPANTHREREEKLADYASLGVSEIWVWNPEDRSVEVLYLEAGQYRRHACLSDGILIPKHFPTVQIQISEIWPPAR